MQQIYPRGVLKIQLILFYTSFHAVGLAGLFPPMRSAWQAYAKRVAGEFEILDDVVYQPVT